MPGTGHDTQYLQELVGEALARGCAACIAAQPNDPVDYLGQWLLRYVKNAEVEGKFYEQKERELEAKKAKLEEEQAAAQRAKHSDTQRKDVIEKLSKMEAEPRALIQKAVELIKAHTKAGAVYAAAVADVEEPDWVLPEDPEDPAAAESDDESDPVQAPEGEAGAEGAADAPPADGEAPAEGEAVAGAEDGGEGGAPAKPTRPIDYSKKYLSYLAASPGQEFMAVAELTRPGPPPEDAGEDAKPEPVPFTFRILDERMPMVYAPNVAFENSVKFFRDFPKIGAYQACGVQVSSTGEFKAIVAADTLFPEGSGQPLSQEDQDFIWEVSLALSKAYEAAEVKYKESLEGKSAKDTLDALKKTIQEIYFPPPAEEGEEGAADAAAQPPATEPEAPPAEEAGEVAPPPEGEDVDPVVLLTYEVDKLTRDLAASDTAQQAASKALSLAQQVLAAINGTLTYVAPSAVTALRSSSVVPQATFHVLKACLHLLEKDPETFRNWKRAFGHFATSTFDELVQYDAAQERKLDVWKRVRCAYKGVRDAAKLSAEMPDTHLGVLLLMFLKQVRKVGRRAAAYRGHCKTSEELGVQLEAKKQALEEAQRKKAEEEEAARKAAEEGAARLAAEEAAAAAAAEGEGEGQAAEGTAEE